MKKLRNILFTIVGLLGIGTLSVFGATIFQGYQGGTGIGTATTSDVGKVLTVASSSPWLTYVLSSVSSATTTINGVSGPNFTFSLGTSGTAPNYASSTGDITLNLPYADGTHDGQLSSTTWTTFNNKQTALVSGTNIKTVNGTSLLGSGDVGTIDIAHGGTATTATPGQDQILIGNGTGYDLKKLTVSSNLTMSTSGNSVSLGSANRSNYFLIENPTATEDDAIQTFDSTSTLKTIYAVHKTNTDTITFNLCWSTSRATATSSATCAFTNYLTVTATTTPTATTTFANSSIPAGSVMRLVTSAASSTQFDLTYYFSTP